MSQFEPFQPDDAEDDNAGYRPQAASPGTGLAVAVCVLAGLLVVAAIVVSMRLL